MQELLVLAGGRNRKSSYSRVLAGIETSRRHLEAERELRLGEAAFAEQSRNAPLQRAEAAILDTLRKIVPAAAFCYEQALSDLRGPARTSYRGCAAELREALREVLDHLAPDQEVMAAPGFSPEASQSRPTMRQKARFIMKARGMGEKSRTAVEESVSAITRSVYERASASVHTSTSRGEVLQLKRHADAVLCDLLEIR